MASEYDEKKEHLWFDPDNSEYLRSVANRTGKSITRVANELIRMIGKMEERTEITLKETELHTKNGRPAIKFKKGMQISIKL
jgi:hypothetical protein